MDVGLYCWVYGGIFVDEGNWNNIFKGNYFYNGDNLFIVSVFFCVFGVEEKNNFVVVIWFGNVSKFL